MLREGLKRIAEEYLKSKSGSDDHGPLAYFIASELPRDIATLLDDQERTGMWSNPRELTVVSSVPVEGWTSIPWIDIRDRRLEVTDQNWIRVRYYFAADMSQIILCLALGGMNLSPDAHRLLGARLLGDFFIPPALSGESFDRFGRMPVGSLGRSFLAAQYESSVMGYKIYNPARLSTEEELRQDFDEAVYFLQVLAGQFVMPKAPGMARWQGVDIFQEVNSAKEMSKPAPQLFTVWYGTNRKPTVTANGSLEYTHQRDACIHWGTATVSIPKSHMFGSVGSSWFERLFTANDDRLKLVEVDRVEKSTWFSRIRTNLLEFEPEDRGILLYIHGYNVSFEAAAIRAAQLGCDLKVPTTGFFSWPSRGSLRDYAADAAAIEGSEEYLTEWLIEMATRTRAERVSIVAHSMGNRGFLRALHRISMRAAGETGVRFAQIFLAAPDMDVDLFRSLAHVYPQLSERTTLYVSPRDRAMEASFWLYDFPRVGYTPPVTVVNGIDTIEVSDFDLTNLGHSYFAEAERVLYDMSTLLLGDRAPGRRARIIGIEKQYGLQYWGFS